MKTQEQVEQALASIEQSVVFEVPTMHQDQREIWFKRGYREALRWVLERQK